MTNNNGDYMVDNEKIKRGTIETLRAIKSYCEDTKNCNECIFDKLCQSFPCYWEEEDIQMIGAFKGRDANHEN